MKKERVGKIRITIPAGSASPSPPIGPILGQFGVNLIQFCKDYNKVTQDFEKNTMLPVKIIIYQDKSYTFWINSPNTKLLVNKILEKNKNKYVSLKQVYEVALIKKWNFNLSHVKIKSLVHSILSFLKNNKVVLVVK